MIIKAMKPEYRKPDRIQLLQEEVTLTFRNEEEDIELEIYQLMLPSASNSKILITYYWVCPDGEIVDGKVVTTK